MSLPGNQMRHWPNQPIHLSPNTQRILVSWICQQSASINRLDRWIFHVNYGVTAPDITSRFDPWRHAIFPEPGYALLSQQIGLSPTTSRRCRFSQRSNCGRVSVSKTSCMVYCAIDTFHRTGRQISKDHDVFTLTTSLVLRRHSQADNPS